MNAADMFGALLDAIERGDWALTLNTGSAKDGSSVSAVLHPMRTELEKGPGEDSRIFGEGPTCIAAFADLFAKTTKPGGALARRR